MAETVYNILENWFLESNYFLSDFNPKNFSKKKSPIEKVEVGKTYRILKENLPEKFFIIRMTNTPSLKSRNWIHMFLGHPFHASSRFALSQLCSSITYMNNFAPEFKSTFKSLAGDAQRLRDFCFELFIYQLFEESGYQVEKKVYRGKQELEGYVTIEGIRFLIECKKIYPPNEDILDLRYMAFTFLYSQAQRLKGLERTKGLIGGIKFPENYKGDIKQLFIKKIKKFIHDHNHSTYKFSGVKIEYHNHEDGILDVVDYDENLFNELEKDDSKYDLLFTVTHPPKASYTMPNIFSVGLKMNFSLAQSQINKKVVGDMKEKRNQHSTKEPKIFFFDSEAIADVSIAVFRTPKSFDQATLLKEYMEKYDENEVVVFVIRNYADEEPTINLKRMAKGKYRKIMDELMKRFSGNAYS